MLGVPQVSDAASHPRSSCDAHVPIVGAPDSMQGQRGHFDWSAAVQPNTHQSMINWAF